MTLILRAESWSIVLTPPTNFLDVWLIQSIRYFCYEYEQYLVGIISIFQFEKIDQLFVDPAFFKRGIARRLWERARCESKSVNGNAYYWVRSSSMAVPVYEKFGFSKIGAIQTKNGISHQFLELKTTNSSN